jgi:uncharacterized membrane protein YgcG
MSDTVVRWAIVLGAALVVYALVTLVQRMMSAKARRQRARPRAPQPSTAMHLPADDPLWREYSQRLDAVPEHKRAKRAERARRRQKSTATWAAGGIAGGQTDGFGCSGGSSCGGGGCGGGG